ncbi:MAG: hypothetical protein EZS28_002763 [Streblomastix strix]|uniref:Uncharacterized protein n=1 Tax=Streblomastix strix TaxID=222440 RepID=A0A5J4X4P2_9EUKA|nr:MAG: hypothetical protein EZS28_002763 [Streblomastix strix]
MRANGSVGLVPLLSSRVSRFDSPRSRPFIRQTQQGTLMFFHYCIFITRGANSDGALLLGGQWGIAVGRMMGHW